MLVENRGSNEHSIVLDDVFDFKCVEKFRQSYETITLDKCEVVNVDFTNTRYMDSSALGMLLNIKNFFKGSNVSVKLVNVNEQIKKILMISRFDQRFVID